jgi:hypothetical protein
MAEMRLLAQRGGTALAAQQIHGDLPAIAHGAQMQAPSVRAPSKKTSLNSEVPVIWRSDALPRPAA